MWSAEFLGNGGWSLVGSGQSVPFLRALTGCLFLGGGIHAVQPVTLRVRLLTALAWFSLVATACAVGAVRIGRAAPLFFLPWCTAPFLLGAAGTLAIMNGVHRRVVRPSDEAEDAPAR